MMENLERNKKLINRIACLDFAIDLYFFTC